MKTQDLQNKADRSVTEACPHCGLPLSDWRCRPVPKGFYCQAKGLIEDTSRMLSSVQPDPLKPQIEADERVKHATAKYDAAQREAEQAHNEWEAAALAARHARQQRSAARREVVVGGRLTEIAPGAPSLNQVSRLEETQAQADTMREFAGEQAVKARIELDQVRAWVRGELEALEQVAQIREQQNAGV
jgi:hypothetical protein